MGKIRLNGEKSIATSSANFRDIWNMEKKVHSVTMDIMESVYFNLIVLKGWKSTLVSIYGQNHTLKILATL